jgi:hypothetical protein
LHGEFMPGMLQGYLPLEDEDDQGRGGLMLGIVLAEGDARGPAPEKLEGNFRTPAGGTPSDRSGKLVAK